MGLFDFTLTGENKLKQEKDWQTNAHLHKLMAIPRSTNPTYNSMIGGGSLGSSINGFLDF